MKLKLFKLFFLPRLFNVLTQFWIKYFNTALNGMLGFELLFASVYVIFDGFSPNSLLGLLFVPFTMETILHI